MLISSLLLMLYSCEQVVFSHGNKKCYIKYYKYSLSAVNHRAKS